MSLCLTAEDYTVAWFAPLHFEASAALLMLDEHHVSPLPNTGQQLCYRFGRMGRTNVAIAFFPAGEIGIGVAGYMASEVQRDLPNIKTGLLVGVGAGIPRYGHDLRLGDVVIATPTENNSGVLGYDMVKVEPEKIVLKQWQECTRSAYTLRNDQFPGFPGDAYKIQAKPREVQRDKLPSTIRGTSQCPLWVIWGATVIKSADLRDELAREYKAIAIEMEAAGMMNTLPVAVIRGISDWANADKNDVWQGYAAATAAAAAKELLACLDGSNSISYGTQIRDQSRMNRENLKVLLASKAAEYGQPNMDWQNSVVDLLKILNLDSSPGARKRLAQRWNILVGENGSASRNVALHRTITERLATNNGVVPDSLLRGLSVEDYGS
ncbi:hypothetical protein AAWM_10535 [Aspergillus awamori]|uniref:DUF3597 domain-containing protein n=1 Tax=Aspergillus awamori TaxID=105351 RepID=A0A401L860_ASPAW|nr:hypothetical protein AAWM_10535 [Aspergillus awamori]GKZ61339.1 hypothetical protein AnigIFM49718_008049 [Aspergillus niger]